MFDYKQVHRDNPVLHTNMLRHWAARAQGIEVDKIIKGYEISLYGYPLIWTEYDNFLPSNMPHNIASTKAMATPHNRMFGRVAYNADILMHEDPFHTTDDEVLPDFSVALAKYIMLIKFNRDKANMLREGHNHLSFKGDMWPRQSKVEKIVLAERLTA